MEHPVGSDFRWESLTEEEKQVMRSIMHAHLSNPVSVSSSHLLNQCRQPAELLPPELQRIRLSMAVNSNTPAPVLHQLAQCDTLPILERIGENPRSHPETLALLAEHPHTDVRASVAENSNSPLELLQKLASDQCPDVRYRLAENHNAPLAILQALTDDHNPYVACRAQRTLSRVAYVSVDTLAARGA